MTTPKEHLIPGSILLVNNVNKHSQIYMVTTLEHYIYGDQMFHPNNNETLIVLESPKKIKGTNYVKVLYNNLEGWAPYRNLKCNTTLLKLGEPS